MVICNQLINKIFRILISLHITCFLLIIQYQIPKSFSNQIYQLNSIVNRFKQVHLPLIKSVLIQQPKNSDGKSHSIQKSKSGNDKIYLQNKTKQYWIYLKIKIQLNIKESMRMGFSKQSAHFSENFRELFQTNKRLEKKKENSLIIQINQTMIQLYIWKKNNNLKNKLENQLYKLYDQFQSQKMKALNTFYQFQIMNNYFQHTNQKKLPQFEMKNYKNVILNEFRFFSQIKQTIQLLV
ncbi:unnamed protein product [Paramecium sonneborni]|uniref:Transmembrane protein n=1 Tax=Paramecium sonneborni TaxID=65129 RepID=A0A8S1NTA3_9CILI|nr:unnamed protein product [Paramecium sonneborni]